jgi:hypothetical protein
MRNASIPLLATLCLFAAPVLAEPVTLEESGLQFNVPRGWSQEKDGNTLTAFSPDRSTALIFIVTDSSVSDELVDGLSEVVTNELQNVNITQKATFKPVNNLNQAQVKGTGTIEGKLSNWDFTLVTGGKKNLHVLAVGDTDQHHTELNWVYRSIKRTTESI